MNRLFAIAFVFMALAALAAPQADARNLGGFSLDRSGPKTPSPTEGGFFICTAHLRFFDVRTRLWSYHTASGYDPVSCQANAQILMSAGFEHNPNPGSAFCACYPGFHGMMIASPTGGNGPLGVSGLSPQSIELYSAGLAELRQRYKFDEMVQEHDALLDAVIATDGQGE
jgi:hypothetical protein